MGKKSMDQIPYIIAEVGSNWKTFEDAKDSISIAKNCGADAVKFQWFEAKDLYGFTPPDLKLPELPEEWIPKLAEKAEACGIDFLCTAFSPEKMQKIDPYVGMHKIASAEICHEGLLQMANTLGKPVMVSTGAATDTEVQWALAKLTVPSIWNYCSAAYPAKYTDLSGIQWLKNLVGQNPVGFSDHSLDVYNLPLRAIQLGAVIIEKHFKLERVTDTPDSSHSLTEREFQAMVMSIRDPLNQTYRLFEEHAMIFRHKRRLIAIQPIEAGQELIENVNFGIYRSLKDDTNGLTPLALESLKGKKATKNISIGEPIGPDYHD